MDERTTNDQSRYRIWSKQQLEMPKSISPNKLLSTLHPEMDPEISSCNKLRDNLRNKTSTSVINHITNNVPIWFLKPFLSCLFYFEKHWFAASISFLFLIPPTRADDGEGDDFANNLFSDLAPILALFGEQVAKQFLSESSGWADNILFAMAPLGVITGIVSAIRVAGDAWLRSLVGRGKEGRALAELELMSSNSQEVGEMWNGQAIVRVFGAPQIFQFIYSGELLQSDPTRAVSTLTDGNPFFERVRKEGHQLNSPPLWNEAGDVEMRPLLQRPRDPEALNHTSDGKYPPNISLNARGELISDYEKWFLAVIGIAAQLAVLFYGGLISYHPSWKADFLKNNLAPSRQAFPCTAAGTVLLNIGMLICSYVIDCSSIDEDWRLKNTRNSYSYRYGTGFRAKTRRKIRQVFTSWRGSTGGQDCNVAWIQKGGTVNDQVFGPYIISGHKGQKIIKTSYRCDKVTANRLRWWVLPATFLSVAGFVIQFIGLRGMHWSATIAQLAATAFMTVIRSFVRRRMFQEPDTVPAIEGYELDSMSREMNQCSGWVVVSKRPEYTSPSDNERLSDNKGLANSVLLTRIRLGELSQWSTNVYDIAASLCTAIEHTMNTIYRSEEICLTEDASQLNELCWNLGILTLAKDEDREKYEELKFKITRPQSWGSWEVGENTKRELRAVLSLWVLHFWEQEKYYKNGLSRSGAEDLRTDLNKCAKVLVWPKKQVDQELFKLWIGFRRVDIRCGNPKDISRLSRIPEHQFIGSLNSQKDFTDTTTVTIIANASAEKLFAQQIFSSFLSEVIPLIGTISGSTEVYKDDKGESDEHEIRNSVFTQLVETIYQTRLGTKVEILVDIISQFGMLEKLPEPELASGGRVIQLHIEDSKRRSRINNDWEAVSLHLQQSIKGHEWVSFPAADQLEAWGAWQMAARFCKRVGALAGWGGVSIEMSSDPQNQFQEWLKNINKDSLPSSPREIQPESNLIAPPTSLWPPDSETSRRVHKLLAPFVPVYQTLTDDKEGDLLRRKIDITTKEELLPALREAVMNGYDSVVEMFMDHRINTSQADNTAEGLLALAASKGQNSVIQLLLLQLQLNFPKDYREFQAGNQPIPLWAAAAFGQKSTVELLLMYMTGVNEIPYKECALVLASCNGHIEIVQLLYSSDMISTKRDEEIEEVIQKLVISKNTLELGISWWGWNKTVDTQTEALLELEIPPKSTRRDYETFILQLLSKGSILTSSRMILIRTALQAAAEGGHLTLVNQLIERGVDINARGAASHGRTALQAAAGNNLLKVVDQLIEKGASVNAEPAENHGRTALQAAAEGGHLAVVDRLLERGATVNAEPAENYGRTALQAAEDGGHHSVAERLRSAGAH